MNIIQIIKEREIGLSKTRYDLNESLESSFLNGNFRNLNPNLEINVTSTIAISFSPDGSTVATTHGDHTVKVFMFHSNKLLREFHGHPRTPWTVKYHPFDSNIVASGCLGYEVFSVFILVLIYKFCFN